jgi:5-methylthioadenosine/S-adenosylhomocysteine deaminase
VKTIIRNVRVLTMDPQGTEHARATVAVQDGVITVVDAGNAPGAAVGSDVREIDGAGHLVMPGLVNAHFHSSVNHLKGSLDSLPLELFMLYESPADGAVMDPRAVYVRTMLGALEMLKSGVTAVLDDAFFVPARTRGFARPSLSTSPMWPKSTSCRFLRTCCRLLYAHAPPRPRSWTPTVCSVAINIS